MKTSLLKYNPLGIPFTKYLFFTGKGGVGKTSLSAATAVALADSGKKVLLVSTDPASNLQDLFETELTDQETWIKDCPNLAVVNVDPLVAAAHYRESVVAPYRELLPKDAIENMEEQLSGSCTVEIAAFNEFVKWMTDNSTNQNYDYIIFDTAPTGHTLRLLELPSAWNDFLDQNKSGASCLGQLSGLKDQKEQYQNAVLTLSDPNKTTMVIVTRIQNIAIMEANRSSLELADFGIKNQLLVFNSVLEKATDTISQNIADTQEVLLKQLPSHLEGLKKYYLPLKSFNIVGLKNIRSLLENETVVDDINTIKSISHKTLNDLIEEIVSHHKRLIFTMGKGGVGKTTIASKIAKGLMAKGLKVHLTTTDPANHLQFVARETQNLRISHIDEKAELLRYQEEVLAEARKTMNEADLAYVEEDLRSPCTQEIAVFRAFAEIVHLSDQEVVVIDTAPTGHTLLLLDSTQSYSKELTRSSGHIPDSVYQLLPKLRNQQETEVIIVTLPEATPVLEAKRLRDDLSRAQIHNRWWVINQSLLLNNLQDPLLKKKAGSEARWIEQVDEISKGNFVMIPWQKEDESL